MENYYCYKNIFNFVVLSLDTYGICIPNGQQMTVTTNQNWNDNIHSYDTSVGEALTSHLKSLILACLTYKTDISANFSKSLYSILKYI